MKKIIVSAILAALLSAFMLPVFSACETAGEYTRSDAAKTITETLGFSGGDTTASDVNANTENSAEIQACISRDIFGETGNGLPFRPDDKLTRYELSKVALHSYAALECIRAENIAPGTPKEVADIDELTTEQQWYVYAALEHGYMETDEDGNFRPDETVTEEQLKDTLAIVQEKTEKKAVDFETYEQNKLETYYTHPTSHAPYAEKLTVFNGTSMAESDEKMAVSTLQGLVNRDKIQLYVQTSSVQGDNLFYSDYAIEKGYFGGYDGAAITALKDLFVKYKDYLKKVVVYDPDKPFTINTCVDIASVEDRVLVSPRLLPLVQEVVPDVDVFDVKTLELDTQYDAQLWSYENCFQFLRRDVLAYMCYNNQQDWSRDYPVQMKIPTIWIQKVGDDTADGIALGGQIMQKYPANIPVLGNQTAYIDGMEQGLGEVEGVLTCGEYGKYTPVWDWSGNLSFHTGIHPDPEAMKFKNQNRGLKYDPNKKYVAILMADSGDAPCYYQYGFHFFQWRQEERGKFPYSYTYALNNYDLNPLLTQKLIEEATPNDHFYAAVSGLGYMYPLGNYGGKGVINDEGQIYMEAQDILADHYAKANEMCRRLGFDAMQIHSFTKGNVWEDYHYSDFDNFVAQYTPDIKTFVVDIPRLVDDIPADKITNRTGYEQSLFHNMGSFSSKNFTQEIPNQDEEAIQWLYDDISRFTRVGDQNLYAYMAYSWHYGPNRVKQVLDRLDQAYPGEYVYVSIGELADLYEQKLGLA